MIRLKTPEVQKINIKPTGTGGGQGLPGLSAYELAVQEGFNGTLTDWLDSLKGADGQPFRFEDFTPEQLQGLKGDAFTFEDFTQEQLDSLKGTDGLSAYQSAVTGGYTGTQAEFYADLAAIDGIADELGAI